jgi:Fe2+ or Zn2+ uptake regulation protein/rubrerythrin
MRQKKRFQKFLDQNKLKKTSQRARVWETLVDADDHPSVEQIYERLIAQGHRIGLSTIYRTLKILLESGMIRQARLQGITRYEPLINEPNHIHFVCNRCGRTDEFPSSRIEELIREETDNRDFQPVYSRYAIFGYCRKCDREQAREAGMEARERQQKILARDALELTLAVERRGYSFYTHASKRTKSPGGQQMFRELAEEESQHMDRLQAEYRSLLDQHGWLRREPGRLPSSRQIADQIFPERKLLDVDVLDSMTDLEALGLAIDLERRSQRFFSDFARQMEDPHGRRIFREFAEEERSHLESLRNEYARLIESQDATETN